MQINNVDLRTGNVSFLALQSIKFKNRYKKLPELQLKLLDSIASNKALNQIYRKYDLDIIFKTYKDIGKYFSIMEVWCNNDKISFNRTFEQIINPGYQFSIDTFYSASLEFCPLSVIIHPDRPRTFQKGPWPWHWCRR